MSSSEEQKNAVLLAKNSREMKSLTKDSAILQGEPDNVADLNKNQKMSIPVTFWNAFREVLAGSTVHGVAPMFRTHNHIVRFVWLVLTLAGLGAATYLTYLSTNGFFNYEVSVSISSIDESPIDFP
jgi:hypothetical protein